MATSPGSSSSNPRKFSEKIALHNQKQAEETRAFDELMTDLTMSRVQFQKVQQLRLAQSRAQYYGGSLPNVNQISSSSAEFQITMLRINWNVMLYSCVIAVHEEDGSLHSLLVMLLMFYLL